MIQPQEFVSKWIKGHEPDTFIKNEHGNFIYSAGPTSINLVSMFTELLEDYTEALHAEGCFMTLEERKALLSHSMISVINHAQSLGLTGKMEVELNHAEPQYKVILNVSKQ